MPIILRPTYAATGNEHSTEFQGSHFLQAMKMLHKVKLKEWADHKFRSLER
jgi:hypothetical protein